MAPDIGNVRSRTDRPLPTAMDGYRRKLQLYVAIRTVKQIQLVSVACIIVDYCRHPLNLRLKAFSLGNGYGKFPTNQGLNKRKLSSDCRRKGNMSSSYKFAKGVCYTYALDVKSHFLVSDRQSDCPPNQYLGRYSVNTTRIFFRKKRLSFKAFFEK